MEVKTVLLRAKVLSTLKKNFPEKQCKIIADYLLWAEMSGIKTQGIVKLAGTEPLQDIKPKKKITVKLNTPLSQLIDAGGNPAILVSSIATDSAIKKAKKHGFGIVGVRNTFSSNGAQAYYLERIAKKNLIGVMCSRSPSATAGFGSIDPLFGTNPIGFGFPTNGEPLVFDMATSAITWYGLVIAKARGEKIPESIAIDSSGNPTIDPAEAMNGALLSFDKSYKGAGISMVVEILAGPLIGSAYIDNKTFKEEWGSLIIAINPDLLGSVKKFKSSCSDLIQKVKKSRKKSGVNEIRLPGERAKESFKRALKSKTVDIDEFLLKELNY